MALLYWLYLLFNPYDEVRVGIHGLPPDTRVACLVAKNSTGETVMPWSAQKVFPFEMHPDNCTISEVLPGESELNASVRWVASNQIGILRRDAGGKWFVAWFNRSKSSPDGRWLFIGGGHFDGNWPDAREVEQWSKEKVRSLGFHYFLEH